MECSGKPDVKYIMLHTEFNATHKKNLTKRLINLGYVDVMCDNELEDLKE